MATIRRFLWYCAGVDAGLARQVTTGHVTLTSVGATVLFTAMMAFFSGSYAMYFVFASWPGAIAFGCFWAPLIFNLDRYMVSTIRKQGTLLDDLPKAVPRIVMALLISIVVIVPLELRLFQPEIEAKLPEIAMQRQAEYIAARKNGALQGQINDYDRGIQDAKRELEELERKRVKNLTDPQGQQLQDLFSETALRIKELEEQRRAQVSDRERLQVETTRELEGLASGKAGRGPRYRARVAEVKAKDEIIDQLDADLKTLRAEHNDAQTRLDTLTEKTRSETLRHQIDEQENNRKELQQRENRAQDAQTMPPTGLATLLTRLLIVYRLAAAEPTVDWTVTLLRLLIVLVELSPIILKLMSPRSAYDALRDAAETEEVLKYSLLQVRAQANYDQAVIVSGTKWIATAAPQGSRLPGPDA